MDFGLLTDIRHYTSRRGSVVVITVQVQEIIGRCQNNWIYPSW